MTHSTVHKRLSTSQPALPTSPPIMMNLMDTDAILFTRGPVEDLLFDVAKQPYNTIASLSENGHKNIGRKPANRSATVARTLDKNTLSDTVLVKPPSSESKRASPPSRRKLQLSRTDSFRKTIHRIPCAKTEGEVVSDSNRRLLTGADSDKIQNDQDTKAQNGMPSPSPVLLDLTTEQLPMSETIIDHHASSSDNKHALIVKDDGVNKTTENSEQNITEVLTRTSIAETTVSTSHVRTSIKTLNVLECWQKHSQHIKSHTKTINRVPRERLFRKSYTSVVDVNSQYNFMAQGKNNNLKSMTWVHKIIVPDFEEETDSISYNQSSYFAKKTPLEPRRKIHYDKQPLKLGKTIFDSDNLQINDQVKAEQHGTVDLITPEKSSIYSNHNKSKHLAFWELKDDIIPQKLFLHPHLPQKKIISSKDNNQIMIVNSDLKSENIIQNHGQDQIKVMRSLLKKPTVELKTKTCESLSGPYSRSPHLICVETDGWDKIKKLEIKVEDCNNCKSELIFDPTEEVKHQSKIDIIPSSDNSTRISNDNLLMAVGSDIFKSSSARKLRQINFSVAIEMIQFIVEITRRMAVFQRIFRQKRSSIQQKQTVKTFASTEREKTWKAFNDSVELLKQKFPDQFVELASSQKRIPLRSQFEKIIHLT